MCITIYFITVCNYLIATHTDALPKTYANITQDVVVPVKICKFLIFKKFYMRIISTFKTMVKEQRKKTAHIKARNKEK